MAAIFLAAMSREVCRILFTVFTKCGGPNREDDSGAWFWGGDVGTAESSGAVGEVAGGRERLPKGVGGRREPEQQWPTGPCTRTNPALVTYSGKRYKGHKSWRRAGLCLPPSCTLLFAIFLIDIILIMATKIRRYDYCVSLYIGMNIQHHL